MIDVYWWSRVRENNEDFENFGDVLVPYILDRSTNTKYKWIIPNNNRVLRIFKRKRHYFIIGSILRKVTEHSIVWGAGIMFHNSIVRKATFLAVRGPKTRNRLLDLGYQVPERFGDPGILISLFNSPKVDKNYKLGLIPHFLDFKEAVKIYGDNKSIKIINLLSNDPQAVIDEINDCEKVVASSLHGVIVAHALKIPCLWIKISEKLLDDIKFYDYYESMNINYTLSIPFKNYSLNEFDKIFEENSKLVLPSIINFNDRITDLIETFPFKKSVVFKRAVKEYFESSAF